MTKSWDVDPETRTKVSRLVSLSPLPGRRALLRLGFYSCLSLGS